ncbi:hypothetical protein BN2475_220054 [Paraburkholderia ribeironis]|uniref:Uncharacterized protein n=1 Tax=Paraburkholderia ribeironis TaxID=1247936 RepID=A0A1N7RX91_9BURK|nr:hypothetical protein BN2475_220054 [Paraburkholderia ribeironis]
MNGAGAPASSGIDRCLLGWPVSASIPQGGFVTQPPIPDAEPVCVPCRLAAIGALVLALAGGFAYTAGWLTPARRSAARFLNTRRYASVAPHRGQGFARRAVCADDRDAGDRLGDAVRGGPSDHALWPVAFAADRAA